MRIVWNTDTVCFELEFDRGNFQGDLDTAKAAGFRTSGPPAWTWFSPSTKALKALQANRPSEGLTISDEALKIFKSKCASEDEAARIKKMYSDAKAKAAGELTEDEKAAKRAEKEAARIAAGKPAIVRKPRQARGGDRGRHEEDIDKGIDKGIEERPEPLEIEIDGVIYYEVSLPPIVLKNVFRKPDPPEKRCVFCRDPIYWYENQEPGICLWCEKTIADQKDVDIFSIL